MKNTLPFQAFNNPGVSPEWLLFIAILILLAVVVLLFAVYLYRRNSNVSTRNAFSAIPPKEDLSKAREKIFQLLENGKITAQESVDLLKALHESGESKSPEAEDKS